MLQRVEVPSSTVLTQLSGMPTALRCARSLPNCGQHREVEGRRLSR